MKRWSSIAIFNLIDPPQPAADDEKPKNSVTVDSSSGDYLKLEYPKGLSSSERNDAQRRLSGFPPELAQQLLDELAARLKAGTSPISPLVYLAGLIKRANAGKFVPQAALRIADDWDESSAVPGPRKNASRRVIAGLSGWPRIAYDL